MCLAVPLALTTEGGCLRRDQAVNATDAGVGALIVGYTDRGPGEIFRPTLLDPAGIEVPVVSVTGEAVTVLREAAGDEATLSIETELPASAFRNVIAQLGDGPSVLMLGGHLDSVLDGPGLNDNGSGVAALLEIARGMAEAGVPDGWAVRIGLWGAEEFGSIGSRAYVAELGDEVTAYLNLDMTGSVNGATLVYDEAGRRPGLGRDHHVLSRRGSRSATSSTRPSTSACRATTSASRRLAFPTGGLFAGASESGSASNPSAGGGEALDPCYHIACDTIDNVDLERVALFADADLLGGLRAHGALGGPGSGDVAGEHAPIRVVAILGYLPARHGGAQPAARLVEVGAVGEGACAEVVAELREAPRQLARRNLPQAELADTRRVGHPPTGRPLEPMQLGDAGRVPALAERVGHLARGQLEAGLQPVEERRLADARRSGDDRQLPGEPLPQQLDPDAPARAGANDVVADALVDPEHGLDVRRRRRGRPCWRRAAPARR